MTRRPRYFDRVHIPLIARIPGCLRSSWFVLKEIVRGYILGVERTTKTIWKTRPREREGTEPRSWGGCGGRSREVKEECREGTLRCTSGRTTCCACEVKHTTGTP